MAARSAAEAAFGKFCSEAEHAVQQHAGRDVYSGRRKKKLCNAGADARPGSDHKNAGRWSLPMARLRRTRTSETLEGDIDKNILKSQLRTSSAHPSPPESKMPRGQISTRYEGRGSPNLSEPSPPSVLSNTVCRQNPKTDRTSADVPVLGCKRVENMSPFQKPLQAALPG